MSKKVNEAVVNEAEENTVDGEVIEERVEKTFGQKVGEKIDAGLSLGKKVVTSKPAKAIGGIALIGGAMLAGAALLNKNESGGEIEDTNDLDAIDTTSVDVTPVETTEVETVDVESVTF